MISNEPVEDADLLDDDQLLRAYLGIDEGVKNDKTPQPTVPDWPYTGSPTASVPLESDIVGWLKSKNSDWRQEARLMLRAWMLAELGGRMATARILGRSANATQGFGIAHETRDAEP